MWRPVVFVNEIDRDGNCPLCKVDYAECPCPGPTQDDEFEYAEFRGVLMAREIHNDARIIRQIADTRTSNNVLWMNVLELALKHAPKETKAVLNQINLNDRAISGLLERLAQ